MATETKKVNLELEIDTNTVDSSKNRYQGLIDLACRIFAKECKLDEARCLDQNLQP